MELLPTSPSQPRAILSDLRPLSTIQQLRPNNQTWISTTCSPTSYFPLYFTHPTHILLPTTSVFIYSYHSSQPAFPHSSPPISTVPLLPPLLLPLHSSIGHHPPSNNNFYPTTAVSAIHNTNPFLYYSTSNRASTKEEHHVASGQRSQEKATRGSLAKTPRGQLSESSPATPSSSMSGPDDRNIGHSSIGTQCYPYQAVDKASYMDRLDVQEGIHLVQHPFSQEYEQELLNAQLKANRYHEDRAKRIHELTMQLHLASLSLMDQGIEIEDMRQRVEALEDRAEHQAQEDKIRDRQILDQNLRIDRIKRATQIRVYKQSNNIQYGVSEPIRKVARKVLFLIGVGDIQDYHYFAGRPSLEQHSTFNDNPDLGFVPLLLLDFSSENLARYVLYRYERWRRAGGSTLQMMMDPTNQIWEYPEEELEEECVEASIEGMVGEQDQANKISPQTIDETSGLALSPVLQIQDEIQGTFKPRRSFDADSDVSALDLSSGSEVYSSKLATTTRPVNMSSSFQRNASSFGDLDAAGIQKSVSNQFPKESVETPTMTGSKVRKLEILRRGSRIVALPLIQERPTRSIQKSLSVELRVLERRHDRTKEVLENIGGSIFRVDVEDRTPIQSVTYLDVADTLSDEIGHIEPYQMPPTRERGLSMESHASSGSNYEDFHLNSPYSTTSFDTGSFFGLILEDEYEVEEYSDDKEWDVLQYQYGY
ncbi:hypothetical protein BJ508DRAFT_303409 [Ascobolus immersus RN42]|uniref:Uncharacterized protein n=1 Tax=Ascobolus immersus RN42 TaxID=1160509 RepID=A0A3N4IFT2_ASCIM|nr:hypothetical protein BJ508DRAFT_303409 [Ascobolus immersus RN42]